MSAENLIDQFLRTQAIGRRSRGDYAYILRSFIQFEEKLVDGKATVETIRAWLQRQRPALTVVAYQARVVARYLQWRMMTGGASHPLLELRAQYGRRLGPIVRALLEDDYENALRQLRPLPEWGSVLGPVMRAHVERKQSLGYRYESRMGDLQCFDRFLQRHPDLAATPLSQMLEAWRRDRHGMRHHVRVQQCGQILSRALHRHDATTPILQNEAGLDSRSHQQERRPYLFTEAEILRLLDAARSFPSQHASLRPIALHAMITLAYCAGLRVGEIAALTLGDLDLETGQLEIRQTKFFKSRRVPLSPSALGVLLAYLDARSATGAPLTNDAPMWWSPLFRCGYTRATIKTQMIHLLRWAGFKPEPGRHGPRFHDLRHTFVAHRMMQWYREGVDPQSRLPHLATYLGHKDIRSTLVYLQITPELLQQASERYRQHHAGLLRSPGGQP
ncbi:MAG: tyrosine-type recombinase/integrase [Nevskia sp.]|nr:tyrosine-type recombinase/integrase [Nevskia sp.]